jgi:hypothetical protein
MSSSVAITLLPFHAHVTAMALTNYLTQNGRARHRVHPRAFDISLFRRSDYLHLGDFFFISCQFFTWPTNYPPFKKSDCELHVTPTARQKKIPTQYIRPHSLINKPFFFPRGLFRLVSLLVSLMNLPYP